MSLRPVEVFPDDASEVASDADRPRRRRRRSRRDLWRDGLAAHTVIDNLEDAKCYRGYEQAIIASIAPRSVIELELTHRLASLFWRIRRANAIETGLFQIQGERPEGEPYETHEPAAVQIPARINGHAQNVPNERHNLFRGQMGGHFRGRNAPSSFQHPQLGSLQNSHTIAQRFLRLASTNSNLFEFVGSYEARLWRQAAQTIWTLDAMRRPPPTATRRPVRKPVARNFWDRGR
jgi:hypothetical protein